jgi:copper chaperone CopZ
MASSTSNSTKLSITGMTCSGCVKSVDRALSQISGVTAVVVDLEAGHARVEGDVDPQLLVAAITQAGFTARPAGS